MKKVRVHLPDVDKISYYGVKDGEIYEVRKEWDDFHYELNFSFGVVVPKSWCITYDDFEIILPEDLFEL
jgi:hypothetical protein